jgi:putative phosphoesterase
MPVKVVIVGDTHARDFKDLPVEMIEAIQDADRVIHVGDYISKNVLDGFIALKGQAFDGVCGNADPLSIRNEVPVKKIIEVSGKRIGITHPAIGGPSEKTKNRVITKFKEENLDIIVYGHTHDFEIDKMQNMLIINPGKGYLEENSFDPVTSIALLTIGKKVKVKIIELNSE